MRIRILHSLLNRNINIIMDLYNNKFTSCLEYIYIYGKVIDVDKSDKMRKKVE